MIKDKLVMYTLSPCCNCGGRKAKFTFALDGDRVWIRCDVCNNHAPQSTKNICEAVDGWNEETERILKNAHRTTPGIGAPMTRIWESFIEEFFAALEASHREHELFGAEGALDRYSDALVDCIAQSALTMDPKKLLIASLRAAELRAAIIFERGVIDSLKDKNHENQQAAPARSDG